MVHFVHPATEDITLTGIFAALSDTARLKIFLRLLDEKSCLSCTEAMPGKTMAKSTLSNHFRVLREAGLIRTTKQGVENRNVVRRADINARYPGLLKLLVKLAANCPQAKQA